MDFTVYQPTSENMLMERVDSGETDDSPFSSKLTTPTDGQTIPLLVRSQLRDGIDEKTIASLDYFASGRMDIENGLQANEHSIGLDTVPLEAPAGLEAKTNKHPLEELNRVSLSQTSDSLISEDGDVSNISSLDSNQTFPSSHPSLAEIVAQARRSSSALYNLPNSHISIDNKTSDSGSDADLEGDDTILQEDLSEPQVQVSEVLKQPTPDLLFTTSWPEDLSTILNNLTIRSLCFLACKLLLFLPWCIAVGATIILSPTNLSAVAFASCVDYIPRPSTPIEVFAHWATYGMQHVTIFAGFVFIIFWIFPDAGTILLGALVAQFFWAWHDFLPERTTALGEDERQMIYYLARTAWLTGDMGIKKMNGKYYTTDDVDHELDDNMDWKFGSEESDVEGFWS